MPKELEASSPAVRGMVSRLMVAQDARLAEDLLISSADGPVAEGLVPLIVTGYAARVAHEGARVLRSSDTHLGVPTLAELLPAQSDAAIARARHAGKLLDDHRKTFTNMVTEMETYRTAG